MGLESPTYISDLVTSNPLGSDDAKQGDDHIRNLKIAAKNTFPNGDRPFYFPDSVAAQISTVNITAADQATVVPVDATSGAVTVNLPAVAGIPDGFEVTIFKSDAVANNVVIDPNSTGLINGASTYTLTTQFQGVRCVWLETFGAWIAFQMSKTAPFLPTGVLPIASGGTGQDTAQEAFDAFSIKGSDVASATTTDLDAATGSLVDITGTATITAITLAEGRERWVRAAGAFTLTHNAVIILPTSANIVAAAGDFMCFRGYAAGIVRCVHYQRLTGIPLLPFAPARSYAEYADATSLSGTIPADDSIPQNNEGDQILTATLTLKRQNSRVRLHFSGWATGAASLPVLTVAAFSSLSANALQVGRYKADSDDPGTNAYGVNLIVEHAPNTLSELTYQIRAGCGGNNYSFNGDVGSRLYGGASKATLVVEEVFV